MAAEHTEVFTNVQSYTSKVEQSLDKPENTNTQTLCKLQTANGISYLETGRFERATNSFLAIPFLGSAVTNNPLECVSANDIAVYGSLCALASFSRAQIQEKVLGVESTFKQFLELEPQIREMLENYCKSKYAPFLSALETHLRELWRYDRFLYLQIDKICGIIRNRVIVQYCQSYKSISIQRMLKSLGIADERMDAMEQDLVRLIAAGELSGLRVDSHQKIITLLPTDQEEVTLEKIVSVTNVYHNSARLLLNRTALLEANLIIK